jgi:hydroxyacylglutathione hydrolase
MLLRQIEDTALAQYAYLIGCQRTGEALVIDPERDVDRYVDAAAAEGLRLTAAAETHIHADFLSGVRELAARGLTAWLSRAGGDDWQYAWPETDRADVRLLADGDVFHVGLIEIRAIHTPGHTPEHLCFLVTDRGGGADAPLGLASGDFVFVGDVGRPDLLESAIGRAGAMRPAAARLGESVRRVAEDLDGSVLLWPGHGAGSACGKALGAVPISSLGYERRFNTALRLALDDPTAFVDTILDGQPEPPPYFAAMKRLNQQGPPLLGSRPSPPLLTQDELAAHLERGAIVLDTRPARRDFMARHLRGALFAPLDRQFSTTVGSYVTADDTVVLIAGAAQVDTAVRQLIRIGVDRIAGYVAPDLVDTPLAADAGSGGRLALVSTPVTDAAAVAGGRYAGGLIVDVRSASEHRAGHLPGAVNIPHTRLAVRRDELPRNRPLIVHCASGVRAAAAASMLERHGFDIIYVDGGIAAAVA